MICVRAGMLYAIGYLNIIIDNELSAKIRGHYGFEVVHLFIKFSSDKARKMNI